ncbi:hypothetical protein B0H15DRAFT_786997 [Mycena belliarum]|uniref:Uncharacterized protein n=1 Tax=Mycena belliarum TaxID=1033014 RepID=A0AAD6TZC4_9AGAR|nr:hypothetical protein B0H15DRAFT_786997 [Mycena belliae]
MPSNNTIPRLPVELLEEIISFAWHLPLPSSERIMLMRSSALVNSTWADIFDLLSSRDVYVPSSAFADHFLQRLRAQPPAGPTQMLRSANVACQTLTIQLANDNGANEHARVPMGSVLDDLLEGFDAWSLAPNLRRLTVEYLDVGFDDVFRRISLAALPVQVTHLELLYSFSPGMLARPLRSLQELKEAKQSLKWTSTNIKNVSVVGAGEKTVKNLSRACPNAQVVSL